MRRLWPAGGADAGAGADLADPDANVDLDEAYAWPPGPSVVRANMVLSVDGVAVVDDVTGTLSGPADRRVFAVLRGLADVVLVGAGTVRREDYGGVRPSAQRRERRRATGLSPVPPLAVVSAGLDLDPASRLFTDTEVRPVIVTCAAADADRRARLSRHADVVVAGTEEVDLGRALAALGDRGYRRVLCEGGPRLLAEVVAAGLLDELCLTVAPVLTGGGGPLLDGAPGAPREGVLRHVLLEDGVLFLRYAVPRPGRAGQPAPSASSSAVPVPPGSP